jgi:hypothetical protein
MEIEVVEGMKDEYLTQFKILSVWKETLILQTDVHAWNLASSSKPGYQQVCSTSDLRRGETGDADLATHTEATQRRTRVTRLIRSSV